MAEKKQYVTLSLGSFASHVTSHLLNLHDEASELDCIAHDSLHHELSSGRVVPRLVLCDSSGSAGSASFTPISPSNSNASTSDHLSPENESNVAHTDSASSTDALWSGGVEVHSAEKAFTSAFRRAVERGDSKLPDATHTLESEINSWADFLQADISSENVCFPSGVWHGASPVASYGDSADMLCASKLESVIDGVRRQTERCDRLAGIHLITDAGTAFGRAANECLQELEDDLGNDVPVASFGCSPTAGYPGPQPTSEVAHSLSHALFNAGIGEHATLHCYMQCPTAKAAQSLQFQRGSFFHESAVLASAIDSCTLPWRLHERCEANNAVGMLDLRAAGDLISRSTNLSPFCSTSVASPAIGLNKSQISVHDCITLCPWVRRAAHWSPPPSEWTVVRGLRSVSQDDVAQTLLEHDGLARRSISWARSGLFLPHAWPQLPSLDTITEHEAPAVTRVGNSSHIGNALQAMSSHLKANARLVASWGWVEQSEALDASETLQSFAQCFEDNGDEGLTR
jgi:hypothetical protein